MAAVSSKPTNARANIEQRFRNCPKHDASVEEFQQPSASYFSLLRWGTERLLLYEIALVAIRGRVRWDTSKTPQGQGSTKANSDERPR